MVKKQYTAPQAMVISYDGADIVTGSGTMADENGVKTKFSSFNVGWLTTGSDEE